MTMNPMQKASLASTFAAAQKQQKGQATFLGVKPPLEVEQMSITLNASPVEKNSFRQILAFVFEYMKGTDVNENHWAQLKEATGVDEVILSTIFAGALTLIRATTRTRTPLNIFTADCLEVLKIPKEFVVEMGLALQNWRDTQEERVNLKKRIRQPGLYQLKWRIDVTIMTSSMNRLFKPSILVQMTDTNGVIRTFEVSTSMFHHMRMQIARLIKELDATESHPLLQLDKPKPEK